MKHCVKCNKEKALVEFHFRKDSNNYRSECKDCIRLKNKKHREESADDIRVAKKEYYLKNKEVKSEYDKNRYKNLEEESKEKVLERSRNYYYNNKEWVKNRVKEFAVENPEKTKEYKDKSRKKNRVSRNEREKIRKQSDELYKLTHDIRNLILSSFKKNNHKKMNNTTQILGCSIEGFKIHIENQFESWMNWENHGKYSKEKRTRQIDHIIPASSASDKNELIRLNHHTNLRPLCSVENLKKSNKLLK